ncbi:MAG: hypothetical protein NTV14_03500 [Coprothermobacterota bacterium]|nr:hypothetical protein [Coprothermobacterota bacterium]
MPIFCHGYRVGEGRLCWLAVDEITLSQDTIPHREGSETGKTSECLPLKKEERQLWVH